MAKIVKKISNNIRFSKKDRTGLSRSFMNFVDSFVSSVDPKNFNI